MKNNLQEKEATRCFTDSRNSDTTKSLIFAFAVSVFLMFSGKGYAQLNESFNSGIPGAWTIFGNGVGASNWSATTDGYLGTNGTSINPSADNIGNQNTARYFLVTPQIAVPENGEIQFYTKQASAVDNGAIYQIRLSTASQPDINGFNIVLQSYTESNLNFGSQTEYEKKVVTLPPSIPVGLNIYVAFVAVNTQMGGTPTGDEWFVDQVSILTGCEEIADDTVSIDNISVSSAELSWSHPTATNFEIQIIPTGGTPANSGIPVSGTSYSLVNLDPDSEFDIYISAICANNTQSEFTGPYTFETLKYGLSCDYPIIVPDISSVPYVLSDNLANWANPNISYTTQGTNCIQGNSSENYLNGDKIFLTYTPTQDGLITLAQTTFDGGDESNNCYNSLTTLLVYESCAAVGVNCIAGVNTTNGFDPKSINNLLVQAGQTYVIVVSTLFSSGAGVCFELEITSPTCAPPGNFEYNNLTDNSVAYSWDNNGGFSDSWEYVVVPTGSGEPTGSGTATNTNVGTVISGLTPASTYDLYVRSVCSGSPGIWSNPTTFTTQCTTFNTPYFTDFDNATPENPEPCWAAIDKNNDGNTWTFIGGWATVATSISRYENNDVYASPRVNLDGTPKRVRYQHRSNQGASTYTLKLSTTGIGYNDFTTVLLPTTTISNTSFQEKIVDIPEGINGEVNIAWIVEPNTTETGNRILIDEVYIEDKPSCPNPLNPFVLQITTNSAWLFWTAGDTETQWEVSIQDLGSGVPTTPGVLTSSNFPYIANGLDSGNRYEFYVRAVCATNDLSQWVGPVAFTTLCTVYDTPFYESFNDFDADTQKFCWKITNANNDNTTWVIDGTHAVIQTASFTPPTAFNDYLISPRINLIGEKELKFKYRADFSAFASATRFGFEILMSTTNTSPGSFSVISPLEIITNPEYQEKSIIIQGNGPVYIAIRVPPAFTGPWSDLSIDDFSISDAPACPNPSNLIVSTTTATSADLSWTEGYQETAWNIVVQPAGSGVPTTTGVSTTSTNYTATDLNANTDYEFYVMADCGTEGSEWVGPVSFRTLCTSLTSPFVETFNTGSTTEDCWQIVNGNNDLQTWELNGTAYPYEGNQAAVILTATNGNSDDWLISPTITITENQRLRYYYRAYGGFFTEDLEVLLSTDGTGLDQFTTVLYDSSEDTVIFNNEEYKVRIINFPDGISGDINIAFHVPYFPPSPAGYRGLTVAIDNVNIEDRPECAAPTNITFNTITDTSVEIGWDANGSETAWEISVQPSGTPAPVGDTNPSYLSNATTNPFTVTGLIASTSYDVYVRAICDNTESEWNGPEELLTKCSFENLCQYTFILTSDFDISATLDITQNNQVTQSLPFNGENAEEFTVLLCSGVEFSVFFSTLGSVQSQYDNYQFEIKNAEDVTVYTSPLSPPLRRIVYEGIAVCGTIDCPQPTNLSISNTNVLSWTAGGSESQWEVAIQPIGNGTLPQSGTIVSTNFYLPTAADFNNPFAATYEYFVRAICGTDDLSYWTGPFKFIRNDDVSTSITLPINSDESCNISATEVSFVGATVSSQSFGCDGLNAGDVWFDFTAESRIHIIEVNGFTGEFYYTSGDVPYPDVTITLYHNTGTGELIELACTYDKVLVAMYSSELIVGENYKVRLTLNSTASNNRRFKVCLKTPQDLCNVDTVNGGFESPALGLLSGVQSFIAQEVVPGWRQNLDTWNAFFIWEGLGAPGFEPYEGGQSVQLLSDIGNTIDPSDPEIIGIYRDFDSSEITLFDYSFAHLARSEGNTVQLFAGPTGGPYTMISENLGIVQSWALITGSYQVPAGQNATRFIFRASAGDDIGNVIDAVDFVANNEIITESFAIDCNNAMASIAANGVGTWIADESNPGAVIITDATNSATTITNFLQPGVYTFIWKTRYCENSIEITYDGIADVPTVETPVIYCLNATAQPLTATPTESNNLLWYTQAVGGTGSATAPTPDTSIAGNTSYYVANADTTGCEGPRAEIEVMVNNFTTPELTFSYLATCESATVNVLPDFAANFATGGVFSSTTLTVDFGTGEIDIASATAGQHQIVYTYTGDASICTASGTFTSTVEFTQATASVTTFNYNPAIVCILSNSNPLPSLDAGFTQGGAFSSTTLTVDPATGEIDLSSATGGPHDVVYTFNGDEANCLEVGTSTVTIEITASTTPGTGFTYSESIYCSDGGSVSPMLSPGFSNGGTFSSTTGLTIDTTSGQINISTSSVGEYTITYEIVEDASNCIEGSMSSFDITILNSIDSEINEDCVNGATILTVSPINDSYNTDNVTYTWTDANGNTIGNNSETFNATEYASNNPNVSVPTQISVTVSFGACTNTVSTTLTRFSCGLIPNGISPGGDNKNDTFDLTGFGVVEMVIFNRYGTEVFNFNGNYTNQWFGQSKKGEELPDGTYFYSIRKQDGSSSTGWVYINREQ